MVVTTTTPTMTSSAGGNGGGGGVTSPTGSQSRRGGGKATAGGTSPWTQIVRGSSEPVASVAAATTTTTTIETQTAVPVVAVTEEEVMEQGSGNAGKKLAWNKPSSGGGGGTVATAESGPVMGAHSWPALSETTIRGGSSTKSSTDSLKGLADGSSSSSSSSSVVVVSQATVTANSMSPKQGNNPGNPNPISTSNHSAPNRQKFPRRSAGSSSNGSLQPPAAQGPIADVPYNPSPREHSQKSGYMSQSHGGNDHPQQQRNSYKNRSSNSHPRGDGSHHHNYGGKRDHDRGHQDWNSHRNFNARDSQMQPQRGMQRYPRQPPPPPPPPGSAPFIPPMPLRPVLSPISFPEFGAALYYVAPPHPDALRGMPFVGPSPSYTLYFHGSDPQLHSKIVAQINYYFSNENLIKDTYLRQNMDEQGWVPLKLIAGFNKVLHLTDNIQVIVDALRSSSVVEVQGDKIRRRDDWAKWLLPPLITQQDSQLAVVMSRSSSGDLNNQQLQRSSSAGIGPVAIQGGSDLLGKVAN